MSIHNGKFPQAIENEPWALDDRLVDGGDFAMKAMLLAASALLAGCASMKATKLGEEVLPTYERQARVQLGKRLRDPESIQISDLQAAKQENGWIIVCGYYNAKNGFGGYAGRTPFFMFVDSPMGDAMGWERDAAFIIRSRCAASGLSLS